MSFGEHFMSVFSKGQREWTVGPRLGPEKIEAAAAPRLYFAFAPSIAACRLAPFARDATSFKMVVKRSNCEFLRTLRRAAI